MHCNISIHFGTLNNSSFIFEVSFPFGLCCEHRDVPFCAGRLHCYLHSLFKISITFLPSDGFQCWTKLFIFTTNLPVLTSSCPATRYSKPGLRMGQVQPRLVHDSGYNVRFPRKIFSLVDFKTFLIFTLTSAWEPLSWADKIFILSTYEYFIPQNALGFPNTCSLHSHLPECRSAENPCSSSHSQVGSLLLCVEWKSGISWYQSTSVLLLMQSPVRGSQLPAQSQGLQP